MIGPDRRLPWVRALAQGLPFRPASFEGAYATWAYFFGPDSTPGLNELHRVVRPGGPLLIVDNLGDDEFCALSAQKIAVDTGFWIDRGFECDVIETSFEFASLDDARRLLGFFFGEPGRSVDGVEFSFRVGLFQRASRGGS